MYSELAILLTAGDSDEAYLFQVGRQHRLRPLSSASALILREFAALHGINFFYAHLCLLEVLCSHMDMSHDHLKLLQHEMLLLVQYLRDKESGEAADAAIVLTNQEIVLLAAILSCCLKTLRQFLASFKSHARAAVAMYDDYNETLLQTELSSILDCMSLT
jgi:hypothetical protein